MSVMESCQKLQASVHGVGVQHSTKGVCVCTCVCVCVCECVCVWRGVFVCIPRLHSKSPTVLCMACTRERTDQPSDVSAK